MGNAQAWHADGPHLFGGDAAEAVPSLPAHALTVFLPLADVTEAVRCIAHAQRTARRTLRMLLVPLV